MPVSKKRRRKKSNAPPSRSTSTVVTLPDRRAIEGFMSVIGGRRTNDATAKAQEVMYEAWDQTSPRARVALARKALTMSPLCTDAYVLLAEEEASQSRKNTRHLQAVREYV
jgi:ST7 protein